MSHVLLMLIFAAYVSLVFSLLMRDEPREQAQLGALLFGGLSAAGIVLGWLLYPFPL